jgi:DNA repair protein RAD16
VKKDAPDAPKVESPADTDVPKHYCGMCQDEIEEEDAALANCKHIFHRECIMQYASCAPADGKKVTCPVCRTALTIDFSPESLENVKSAISRNFKDALPDKSILNKLDLTQYTSSTKVETLVNALRDMRNQENGHLNKAIVFSQYTAMIEIVEWRLKKAKFTIAKLLGSMPVTQRAANLQAFREDPNVSVILMSLKSGGEGLNLQAANYVYVLEPWWNPAVEMQAVMRVHRIGQLRPVTAVRFSTKGTIEERMMELQEKKQLVFEGCMDGNQAALSQLTAEDLQFLFKR